MQTQEDDRHGLQLLHPPGEADSVRLHAPPGEEGAEAQERGGEEGQGLRAKVQERGGEEEQGPRAGEALQHLGGGGHDRVPSLGGVETATRPSPESVDGEQGKQRQGRGEGLYRASQLLTM